MVIEIFFESKYQQQVLYELFLLSNVWGGVYFQSFLHICKERLDKTSAMNQRYVWSNPSPFLDNKILKALMNQTVLRNRLLNSR